MAKKKKTSTPNLSGLAISRNGNVFTFSWSPVKNSKDQDIKVYVNNVEVVKQDLGKNTKTFTYTVPLNNFYPNAGKPLLSKVSFTLAQKQSGKKESAFSAQKEFSIYPPGQPGYVQPAQDNTNTDTFTYSWTQSSGDGNLATGDRMFSYYHYQTCLVPEGNGPNWGLAATQKIQTIDPTTGALYTNQPSVGTISDLSLTKVIIRELQSDIAARKKRYFIVNEIGPGGISVWTQSEHQLGGSDPIKVQESTTIITESSSTGTSGSIPLPVRNGNPNDSIHVEYAVTPPYVSVEETDTEVKSTLTLPPGFTGWTTGDTFSGSGVTDTYSFNLPTYVVEDTQLFMRINRIHDKITSYGVPVLMNTNAKKEIAIRRLSAPTLSSVRVNEVAKEVTITATNNSQLADGGNRSFLAVYERNSTGSEDAIGVIPYSSSGSSVTFPYDDGATAFGIQCFVANYSPATRKATGVTKYKISNILMQSSGIIWEEDAVSKAPQNVHVEKHNATTALITWDWDWAQADSAEISWSDNELTWESIDEPSTYILTNTRTGSRYVTGLSPTTYHFRVRFIKTENDITTYGVYSETVSLTMSSAPDIPTMYLSDEDNVVSVDDQVTAYWGYESTDGTSQAYAQLAEAKRTDVNSDWTYVKLPDAAVNTETSYTFTPRQFGWINGELHYICVKVRSDSGKESEGYSNPVPLQIAPIPTMTVHGIDEADTDAIRAPKSGEDSYGIATLALKKLPIEFTVSGAGAKGYCSVVIERTDSFAIERPDDSRTTGFKGETIVSKTFLPNPNENSETINVSITADDLKLGLFDNTAKYSMYISITDEYGQTVKSRENAYDFTVDWDYHAQMPSADIQINRDEDIAIITPQAPNTVAEGDFCRIYRMSSDKPKLILDKGTFGETYVDPYPTFGMYGGYRIVYVTKYLDNKTSDNLIAMTEYSEVGNDEYIDVYDRFMVSIDFDGETAEFNGNVSLMNSWDKDFQLTRYLGGAMQGDWNPGVQRSGTITGTIPVEYEAETLYLIRSLADYPGRCHVRTPEGSNFLADVQVKDDREEKWVSKLSKISLSYTKVDGGEDDVVTLEDWRKNNPLDE